MKKLLLFNAFVFLVAVVAKSQAPASIDDVKILLSGSSSADANIHKVWQLDSLNPGHFGVGQDLTTGPNWWSAAADEKTGRSCYDDSISFYPDGTVIYYNVDGKTYVKNYRFEGPEAVNGYTNGVNYTGEIDYIVDYDVAVDGLQGTYTVTQSGSDFIITLVASGETDSVKLANPLFFIIDCGADTRNTANTTPNAYKVNLSQSDLGANTLGVGAMGGHVGDVPSDATQPSVPWLGGWFFKLKSNSAATGVPGFKASKFSVYPTEATSIVRLSQKVSSVEVISLTGQVVIRSANVDQINVSGLASGLYFVKTPAGCSKIVKK